jgi:hypothetical protein
MTGLIDGALDELDAHVRELRREVSRLERFRSQMEATEENAAGTGAPPAVLDGGGAAAQ